MNIGDTIHINFFINYNNLRKIHLNGYGFFFDRKCIDFLETPNYIFKNFYIYNFAQIDIRYDGLQDIFFKNIRTYTLKFNIRHSSIGDFRIIKIMPHKMILSEKFVDHPYFH
jgi:hypothetical protein